MNEINIKNFISEEDCNLYVEYLMDTVKLTYPQALQVVDMLSVMVNRAAINLIQLGADTSEDS